MTITLYRSNLDRDHANVVASLPTYLATIDDPVTVDVRRFVPTFGTFDLDLPSFVDSYNVTRYDYASVEYNERIWYYFVSWENGTPSTMIARFTYDVMQDVVNATTLSGRFSYGIDAPYRKSVLTPEGKTTPSFVRYIGETGSARLFVWLAYDTGDETEAFALIRSSASQNSKTVADLVKIASYNIGSYKSIRIGSDTFKITRWLGVWAMPYDLTPTADGGKPAVYLTGQSAGEADPFFELEPFQFSTISARYAETISRNVQTPYGRIIDVGTNTINVERSAGVNDINVMFVTSATNTAGVTVKMYVDGDPVDITDAFAVRYSYNDKAAADFQKQSAEGIGVASSITRAAGSVAGTSIAMGMSTVNPAVGALAIGAQLAGAGLSIAGILNDPAALTKVQKGSAVENVINLAYGTDMPSPLRVMAWNVHNGEDVTKRTLLDGYEVDRFDTINPTQYNGDQRFIRVSNPSLSNLRTFEYADDIAAVFTRGVRVWYGGAYKDWSGFDA